MDKESLAFYFYDNMVINYAKYMRGGVGSKAARGCFMNAATSLARLGLPNPFEHEVLRDNAAVRPDIDEHKITGVKE